MKFVGGNDLVFSLIALVLLGIVIFIFEKVSYVFDPFIIVFKTIAAPIIVSLILFYLFNPIVNMMERYRIPRVAGILRGYVNTNIPDSGIFQTGLSFGIRGEKDVKSLTVPIKNSYEDVNTNTDGSALQINKNTNKQAIKDFLDED